MQRHSHGHAHPVQRCARVLAGCWLLQQTLSSARAHPATCVLGSAACSWPWRHLCCVLLFFPKGEFAPLLHSFYSEDTVMIYFRDCFFLFAVGLLLSFYKYPILKSLQE